MIINNICRGKYLERPNRFTVKFKSNKITALAHLRDPGRLKELLIPDAELLLRPALNCEKRKTKFDILAVSYENRWVLINSGFHSDIAENLITTHPQLFSGFSVEKREHCYGNSRLDFLLTDGFKPLVGDINQQFKDSKSLADVNNHNMLLEVKGCTLVENGLAKFPDAPTLRGKKHVEELLKARREGYKSAVLFLILRDDAVIFRPNWDMDPLFSEALARANDEGVEIIAYSFTVHLDEDNLYIRPYKKVKIDI